MDYDISDVKGCGRSARSGAETLQDVDTAAIFLDTLKAFDEADRKEHEADSEGLIPDNEESFLPSLENILVFSSYIKDSIEFMLDAAGIPSDPPFELDMDDRTGRIIVRGCRNDLRKISRLINKDKETRDGLVTLLSVADQTYQLLASLDSDSDDSFPEFVDGGKVIYLFGDGYLSLYREHD